MDTSLPPGPPLPTAVQTALMIWLRQPFLRACHRRYGDCFTVRLAGRGTVVFLTDPAVLRSVFTGDTATFHGGAANAPLEPILGASTLMLLDEGEHLTRRKEMLPPFHGDAVRRQTELMAEVAAAGIANWPVGRRVPMLPRMRDITLEVILRTVIGVHDEARLAPLRRALPPLADVDGLMMLGMLVPRLLHVWPWTRYLRARAVADPLLLDEIARARNDPRLDERADVLAMLVRGGTMTDGELRDQLITLLVAGHETTSTGLAWTIERLVRHSDVLALARTATDGGDDDYLDAVVKESLRVRPVVPDLARRITSQVEVAGYLLPTGTMVQPCIGLLHLDERHFADAEEFRPERFTHGRPAPYTWLPFGGGARRCLGATFASVEMRVVLAEVLRRVELEPTTDRAERAHVRHVTLVPHRGARAVVRSRRLPSAKAPAGGCIT
ncbi:MAG: cytochrome P450 [Pseudonocardiaceae bacterium]